MAATHMTREALQDGTGAAEHHGAGEQHTDLEMPAVGGKHPRDAEESLGGAFAHAHTANFHQQRMALSEASGKRDDSHADSSGMPGHLADPEELGAPCPPAEPWRSHASAGAAHHHHPHTHHPASCDMQTYAECVPHSQMMLFNPALRLAAAERQLPAPPGGAVPWRDADSMPIYAAHVPGSDQAHDLLRRVGLPTPNRRAWLPGPDFGSTRLVDDAWSGGSTVASQDGALAQQAPRTEPRPTMSKVSLLQSGGPTVHRRLVIPYVVDENQLPIHGYKVTMTMVLAAFEVNIPKRCSIADLRISYIDEDGDEISVTSDQELGVALHHMRGDVLRLRLQVLCAQSGLWEGVDEGARGDWEGGHAGREREAGLGAAAVVQTQLQGEGSG